MKDLVHPAAIEHRPAFITAPGETDVLMVAVSIILVLSILAFGSVFFRLHTLPERMAHRSHKLQFEIVAVLGLLALFTHIHLFWVAGLLLAMIDIPDFGARSLSRIAGSTEKLAGLEPGQGAVDVPSQTIVEDKGDDGATTVPVAGSSKEEGSSKEKEVVHA
jgi:hypothetical protein